jgi:hypothetical protein
MNTFPTVSFPLGIPDSSVMIRYQGGTQREQPTDAEGRFTEHISLLEDALLVYRDAQNALQIINMKSPVGQKRAASLLGYTYDKE